MLRRSSALLPVAFLALTLAAPAARAQEPVQAPPQQTPEEPAQEEPPSQEPQEPVAQEAPAPQDAPVPPGQASAQEEGQARPRKTDDGLLPRLDIYFPEGDLDLRVNRLINETFFEGQVKYNFVNGDISAFLRYRYYGYRRTTQLTVFDSIEFQEIQDFSSDFDRVRGTLLLMQWPHSYHRRTFLLTELDRVSTNKESFAEVLRLGETNTFVRFGYQIGTPEDSRSNAIVGESRARIERLFTAFREIGPGGAGFTGALTYGFELGIGDFDYAKAEAETLKRFDVSRRTFLVGRLHAGSFLRKSLRDPADLPPEADELDAYAVPRSEFFRLDGRDNLKGVSDRMGGTDEVHTTWEYFFPWFLDAQHDFLRLEWQNWYWILYAGAGNVGFDRAIYTDFDSYIPDAGIGFESSFRFKKYRFFFSGIVAQALKGDGGVEARVSVKSYR